MGREEFDGEGEAMRIREYQAWVQAWDRARGWDEVAVSHTLLHAVEELGEVARAVLRREGYKPDAQDAAWRAELAEELSDLFVMLFKVAYQCGVDVESALAAGMAKAEARYPLVTGEPEMARYLARQAVLRAEQDTASGGMADD